MPPSRSPASRLSQRRHRRVPGRRRHRRVVLHRGQPAHPGRAHRHRDGHRHRSRASADSQSPRATRCTNRRSSLPQQEEIPPTASRFSAASPPKIPRTISRPTTASITTYRSPGRLRHSPGRRHRLRRRAAHSLLRFAAGEDDRLGHTSLEAPASAWTAPCANSAFAASRRISRFSKTSSTIRRFRRANDHGFLDESPELFQFTRARDRATQLLSYVGDVIVNGNPTVKEPQRAGIFRRAAGSRFDTRAAAARHAPAAAEARAERLRRVGSQQQRLLLTDTTFRDAHQSLLATRVRTYDLLPPARSSSRHLLRTVQPGNVGRRHVRHRHALPLRRPLAAPARSFARHIPNICFQMLLRGLERRRLHQLSATMSCRHSCSKRPRAGHRHLPHFRLAQLHRQHAGADGRRARKRRRSAKPPSATPATSSIPRAPKYNLTVLRRPGQGSSRRWARTSWPSRTWPGLCKPYAAYAAGQSAARGNRHPDPLPHARHQRRQCAARS